ncbi:histone deacetylase 4-like isoform X2, partial [Clarias magur]
VMASEEVKQRLQRSILSRQSLRQAETRDQRETEQICELDTQHEHPNTPPCQQRRTSESVLKHKQRRCSSSRRDPFHNSCYSSSQCSPPSDQSEQTSQLSNSSIQLYHQMDRNSNFIGPLKMWIQSPFRVSHENVLHPFIVLQHVYVDTALFTSPHLAVMPDVCITKMHHKPLVRCHSQPQVMRERQTGFHHRYSYKEPDRPSHTHGMIPTNVCIIPCEQRHPGADERTAGQVKVNVTFAVEGSTPQEELCEEHRITESRSSSHLCPNNTLRHRPAFRKPSRSHRPLTHTLSSSPAYSLLDAAESPFDHAHRTGLVYDPQMLKQQCICGDSSCDAEHAGRIPKVFDRLRECGVSDQCKWITGNQHSVEDDQPLHRVSSLAFNGEDPRSHLHPEAVGMAAGCVTQLVLLVAQGRLRNGFAIVQPHGHDASHSSLSKSVVAFNPVAVATKELQKKHNRKILIIDWDDHHCKGTQEVFYTDPNVLLISLHRDGNTASSTEAGRPDQVGQGEGKGFNVNVEWSCDLGPHIGDAEYLAAFRTVIKPIAQEFCPDLVLISTEFNTADGHPSSQGGPRVSAKCFALLTQSLMDLAGGRVVVVLQGGHDVMAVCEASKACVNALLEKKISSLSDDVLMKKPCAAAARSLHRVLQIHSQFWSSVKALTNTVGESWFQAEGKRSAHTDTASALASLSMTTSNYT